MANTLLDEIRGNLKGQFNESASKLQQLRIQNEDFQKLEEENQRLEQLRQRRAINPRETADQFANLLAHGGGPGAAVAFGMLSAQADVADLAEARIEDAKARLQELRAQNQDTLAQRQAIFGQQSTIEDLSIAGAQSAVEGAEFDVTAGQNQQRINIEGGRLALAKNEAATRARNAETALKLAQLDQQEKLVQLSSERSALESPPRTEADIEAARQNVAQLSQSIQEESSQGFFNRLFLGSSAEGDTNRTANQIISRTGQIINSVKGLPESEKEQEIINYAAPVQENLAFLEASFGENPPPEVKRAIAEHRLVLAQFKDALNPQQDPGVELLRQLESVQQERVDLLRGAQ